MCTTGRLGVSHDSRVDIARSSRRDAPRPDHQAAWRASVFVQAEERPRRSDRRRSNTRKDERPTCYENAARNAARPLAAAAWRSPGYMACAMLRTSAPLCFSTVESNLPDTIVLSYHTTVILSRAGPGLARHGRRGRKIPQPILIGNA